MTSTADKRRVLLDLISRTQRSTIDVATLTICQALHSRLLAEASYAAIKPISRCLACERRKKAAAKAQKRWRAAHPKKAKAAK